MKKKSILLLGLATLAMSFGTLAAVGAANVFNGDATLIKAADEQSKDIALTFSKETSLKNVSGYTDSWDAKTADGSYLFTLSKFNNNSFNNNWTYVRCGNKKTAGIATIVTKSALSIPVSKVALTIDKIDASFVNSIYLETSSDNKTWGDKVALTSLTTGVGTLEIANPATDLFYRISFDCKKGSGNGFVQLSKVLFVAGEESTEPSLAIDGEADITLKTGETAEFAFKAKNLPEGALFEAAAEDENVAVITVKEDKTGVEILAGDNAGKTAYKVTAKDSTGNEVASCTGTITVSVAPTSVAITGFEDNAALKLGSSIQLSASVAPESCSQEVVWTVSDASVASVSETGLLTINQYGNKEGGYSVSAASKADSTILQTLHFTIDNEFAISELLSPDGTNYPGNLKEGMMVSTVGTVSAIEDKSVFIQSKGYGIMLYTKGEELASLKLGDGVKASGELKIHNGLTELTNPSATKDDSIKEEIIPVELTAENAPKYESVGSLMSATGAVCQEDKTLSGTKNVEVKFLLADGKTSFVVYIKGALVSQIAKTFGSFKKDVAYDIIGVKVIYNGKLELVIDTGCSYYKTGAKEVDSFIAANITPYKGAPAEGDTCKAKAQRALDAYNAMSEEAKKLFDEDSAYAADKAIYDYWLANSGISAKLNLNNAPFSSKTAEWASTGAMAVVSIAAVALSLGGLLFFAKKHN